MTDKGKKSITVVQVGNGHNHKMTLLKTLEAIDKSEKYDRLAEAVRKIKTEIQGLESISIEDGSDGYDYYIDQYKVMEIFDRNIGGLV